MEPPLREPCRRSVSLGLRCPALIDLVVLMTMPSRGFATHTPTFGRGDMWRAGVTYVFRAATRRAHWSNEHAGRCAGPTRRAVVRAGRRSTGAAAARANPQHPRSALVRRGQRDPA